MRCSTYNIESWGKMIQGLVISKFQLDRSGPGFPYLSALPSLACWLGSLAPVLVVEGCNSPEPNGLYIKYPTPQTECLHLMYL